MRMMAFTTTIAWVFTTLSLALSCVSAARDLRETLAATETDTAVPQVPDAMKVPAGYKVHLKLFGEGHQYYKHNGSIWVQFSAKASLFDDEGKEIGHHYYLESALGGQPSWETQPSKGVPYSLVTAKPVVKITPDPKNIPWVLLKATNSQGDKGYFGDVACATVQHFPRSSTALRIRCRDGPRQKNELQRLLCFFRERVLNYLVRVS